MDLEYNAFRIVWILLTILVHLKLRFYIPFALMIEDGRGCKNLMNDPELLQSSSLFEAVKRIPHSG
jgi:hypothetical protein